MAPATRTRKPAKAKTSTDKPKTDVYQKVTNQIIGLLETGTAPWQKSWTEGGIARSMSTGKAYRGINILLLQIAALEKGYSSPWWGTYKQIVEERGGNLKGQKATQVVLWRPMWIEDKETGKKKKILTTRVFSVFNADQNQNDVDLKLPQVEARPEVESIEECEAALAAYYLTGPSLAFGGDSAHYNRHIDHVQMPRRQDFHSAEEFYGTWFHETVHSTGHPDRLARKDLLDSHRFGDESYSKEELTAEMGAAFLAARTGIVAATLPNSAAYLASWIKALRNDKKMIISAAQAAQKAVDLVLDEVAVYTDEEPKEAVVAA